MTVNKNGIKTTVSVGSMQLSVVGLATIAVGLVLTFVLK
jgi:uncharacterized protein YjeT (DUF2065 family)